MAQLIVIGSEPSTTKSARIRFFTYNKKNTLHKYTGVGLIPLDLPVWILIWRFHVDLSYRVLLQIGHSLRSLGLPMPAEATFCM